jgi:hypothetical protein
MKGYYKIEISTEKELNELTEKVKNSIDFEYRNKIGTIEIDEKYYGDKLNDQKFKVWRKYDIRQGFFDIGFTNHFFIEVDNNKLTLELSRNWTFRTIFYLIISLLAFLLTNELTNLPFWVTGLGLITLFFFHHIINDLTDQSIKEDFEQIIR